MVVLSQDTINPLGCRERRLPERNGCLDVLPESWPVFHPSCLQKYKEFVVSRRSPSLANGIKCSGKVYLSLETRIANDKPFLLECSRQCMRGSMDPKFSFCISSDPHSNTILCRHISSTIAASEPDSRLRRSVASHAVQHYCTRCKRRACRGDNAFEAHN